MDLNEAEYYDFASKISFLEFIQNEFKDLNFPIENFKKELEPLLKTKEWNITQLSDYIKSFPRSFIIFEHIFQLKRFTNAQIIHFIFDIDKLNSANLNAIYEYMVLNLKHDIDFREIFLELIKKDYNDFISNLDKYDKKYLIAIFKLAISKYVDRVIKNFTILEKRIKKSVFEDFSIRFSNYLLDNLRLNKTLSMINIERYLQNKRIPIDTKSLHGNYPKIKIIKALEDEGYLNIDHILNKHKIHTLNPDFQNFTTLFVDTNKNSKIFCTERYIEGIIKVKDNKPKKFDLIIFSNYKPKYLFEINFYTTSGTKIGINQNEYIDLNNYIQRNFKGLKFYWITDGNYWLTPNGKERFLNLLKYFEKIFNINTFKEYIEEFE